MNVKLAAIVAVAATIAVPIVRAQDAPSGVAGGVTQPQLNSLVNAGIRPAGIDGTELARGADATIPPSGTRPAWLPAPGSAALAPAPGIAATLTINAIFDSTITSDPNAAAIMSTINNAIAVFQAAYSDPITVTINFKKVTSGLGSSSVYFGSTSYSTFRSQLAADSTTADDATALVHLPASSTNPVNGTTTINVKTANFRAIGIAANPPPGEPDGYISLNTTLTSPGSPGSSGQYDLLAVVEHEMDEVLGLSSSLPTTTAIFPQDLFRYDGSGNRSFTTVTTNAYFSIDGTTRIVQFHNKNDGADFGDWESNPLPAGASPQVQDAFATPGAHPTLGNSEKTALDVQGYNRVQQTAPTITQQPQSQTIASGQTATMSVTASGTGLSYQWYVGTSGNTGSPIGGATSSSYTTPPLTMTTSYWVRVSNTAGHADSNTATITVTTVAPPSITSQPSSQTVAYGQTATLSVTATGSGLSYQWYAGMSGTTSSPIGGATSSSYTTPSLTSTSRYWVRVSNAGGFVNSNTATISVSFTDSTLTPGTTVIKLVHVTELRTRIDHVRSLHALGPYAYTNATLTAGSSAVKAVDVTDMRTALAQAYTASGMTPPTYSHPTLTATVSTVTAADIQELRNAVVALE